MSEFSKPISPKDREATRLERFLNLISRFSQLDESRIKYLRETSQDPVYYIRTPDRLNSYTSYISGLREQENIALNLTKLISKLPKDVVIKVTDYLLNQKITKINPASLIETGAKNFETFNESNIESFELKLNTPEMGQKKEIIFEKCIRELMSEGSYSKLQELLTKFYTNEILKKSVLNIVLDPKISDEKRLEISKVFINSYGFITFIDLISEYATNEAKRPEIKKLYTTLNAKKVEELLDVFRNPSEIYERPEVFGNSYYDPFTTSTEVSLALQFLLDLGISPDSATVVDLGAGRGRISKGLLEDGDVEKVFAVDVDKTLNKAMEELKIELGDAGERLEPVIGDWHSLSQNPIISKAEIDLGVCYGRSLPHANNMRYLISALSQMIEVTDNWIIDYPNSEGEVYSTRINELRENFKKLGINSQNAYMIFDGPKEGLFINRMIANESQLIKIGKLLGFKVEKFSEINSQISTGVKTQKVENLYFRLVRDKDWDYLSLSYEEVVSLCSELGTIFPEAVDIFLPGWGMTLAQVLGFYYYVKQLKDVNGYSGKELKDRCEELKRLIKSENKNYIKKYNSDYPKARFEYLDSETKVLMPFMGESPYFYPRQPIIHFRDSEI